MRRTSNGSGKASADIGLGTAYQEVTDTSEGFFRGDFRSTDDQVQLRLESMSLQIAPGRHSTTVYFTVMDVM